MKNNYICLIIALLSIMGNINTSQKMKTNITLHLAACKDCQKTPCFILRNYLGIKNRTLEGKKISHDISKIKAINRLGKLNGHLTQTIQSSHKQKS